MTPGRFNRTPRRYRWRTLREDYLDFVDGNVVAALLLDYFAKVEDVHGEIAEQGEKPSEWREISGKYGGLIVMLRPQPTRETIRAALAILVEQGLIHEHPDNGRPAAPGAPAQKSRYRLDAKVLITREGNWRPHGRGVPSEDADPLSAETLTLSAEPLTPLSAETSHESVIENKKPQPPLRLVKEERNVFTLYHRWRGHFASSPMLVDELKDLSDEYDLDAIEAAMAAAAQVNATSLNYVRAVLQNTGKAKRAAPVSAAGSFWGRDLTDGE
jgi:hypothetical protein